MEKLWSPKVWAWIMIASQARKRKLWSLKVCAALVMIAYLAALAAAWGMEAAGRKAIAGDKNCTPKDLARLAVQLEMASSAGEVREILKGKPANAASVRKAIERGQARSPGEAMRLLNNNPDRPACIGRGEAAKVMADFRFIPAYSVLTLGFFLFIAALRMKPSRRRGAFVALGAVLAAAMFLGDTLENFRLFKVIDLAGKISVPRDLIDAQLSDLRQFSYLKMWALALSAALLGVLWRSRSGSRFVWVPRLLGVAAGAVFAYGLVRNQWQVVSYGFGLFAGFWLAGLAHAVAVAVDPPPPVTAAETAQVQGGQKP